MKRKMSIEDYGICSNEINKTVNYFRRVNPWKDSEDLRSELWVCALETYPKWKRSGGAQLSSYLFARFRWYLKDLIKHRVCEQQAVSAFLQQTKMSSSVGTQGACVPVDDLVRDLHQKIKMTLPPSEGSLLDLMLCPTPSFRRFVQENWNRTVVRALTCSSWGKISQVHYSKFLGMQKRKVSRKVEKINSLLREAIRDAA